MNATSASLLGLLDASGGELTGGELVQVAEQRIGDFWSLTRSQVYRELAALEAEGAVRPGPTGARDRRPYRITASGRRAYKRWLTEALPDETIRVPLLLVVAFGAALPAERVHALLADARAQHEARLAGYRELAAELDRLGVDAWTRATLSFGEHYEQAVLRWFAGLPPEISGTAAAPRARPRAADRADAPASRRRSAAPRGTD